MQRGDAARRRDRPRIGPGLEQHLDYGNVSAPAREVEGRIASDSSLRLHVGAALEERTDGFGVSTKCRVQERSFRGSGGGGQDEEKSGEHAHPGDSSGNAPVLSPKAVISS